MNLEMNKNEDANRIGWSNIKKLVAKIEEGGGKKSIQKQKERNKLTARERIEYLLDEGKYFLEIGAFAGYGMYEEFGGCPAGGVVGRSRLCFRKAMRNRCERPDSKGRRMVSHYGKEKPPPPGNRDGK